LEKSAKTCFISYCHEGSDRDTLDYLIHTLKDHLGSGEQLLYDQHLSTGEDFKDFMAMLDRVDVVIILLSPSYKRKVVERQGGVYEEFRRIWARHTDQKIGKEDPAWESNKVPFEILPILFSGSYAHSTPDELLTLKQLDLTGLRVSRKPNGEFVIPQSIQNTFTHPIQSLASQIHAESAVKSQAFIKLSNSYYDRLFVDLKASFNDPIFASRDYLDTILVKTSTYFRIESQLAFFVIGRKGSGKSTLTQVLPLTQPDRYQGIIEIIADDFNLESLYGLYSDQQFRSDVNAAVSRDRAFELTWEALLMLAAMDVILNFSINGLLNSVQSRLVEPIEKFINNMKGNSPLTHWRTGDLFNYAFTGTMSFVKDCIDGTRSDPALFLVDIGVRFNRERFLAHLFSSEVMDSFRMLLRTFNKRFLITLDGFDTAFDRFRLDSIRAYDEEKMRRRAHFEVDWLRSLLSLTMQARSRGQDYFYSTLDFCIAAPKDRFMEVVRVERDSYRHWQRWCTLHWSGIELAILLRKRLQVLAGIKKTSKDKDRSPKERLDVVLRHKMFQHILNTLEFEYNGKTYTMPLFMYILRHTFWRPREVLVYFAALLALSEDMKRWGYEVTTEIVRKCVKATTHQIIESEFINEFRSTVVNIRDIVQRFKKSKPVISFEKVRDILSTVDFKFAASSLEESQMMEKIQFLYEIGFIGVKATKEMQENFGLDCEHAFYFNEGSSLFIGTDEDDMKSWEFIIHPIFSEYLRLDTKGEDLSLQFNWDYLHKREAFFSANPNA
jgi:energy-coupling factor transporter ATP-binding protein EcfA2